MRRRKRRIVADDATRNAERQLRATSTEPEKLGMECVLPGNLFSCICISDPENRLWVPRDICCCYFWQHIYKLENYKCKLQPQRVSANEGTVHKLPILICLLACVKTEAGGSWGEFELQQEADRKPKEEAKTRQISLTIRKEHCKRQNIWGKEKLLDYSQSTRLEQQ